MLFCKTSLINKEVNSYRIKETLILNVVPRSCRIRTNNSFERSKCFSWCSFFHLFRHRIELLAAMSDASYRNRLRRVCIYRPDFNLLSISILLTFENNSSYNVRFLSSPVSVQNTFSRLYFACHQGYWIKGIWRGTMRGSKHFITP